MKILLVHNFYQNRAGEASVFSNERSLLLSKGHELITYTRDNSEIEGLSFAKKLSLPLQTIWSQKSLNELAAILTREKPQVVHFHNTFPMISPSVYWACNQHNIPVIQTLHNFRLACPAATFYRDGLVCEDCIGKRIPWPGVIHSCYRDSITASTVVASLLGTHNFLKTWTEKITTFIVLSHFSRNKYIEMGLPEEKISVKPNFIFPPAPSLDPIKQKLNTILFVGRLSAEKGIHTLLNAFKYLPDVTLEIVGAGPLQGHIQNQIAAEKLDNIILRGNLPHDQVFELMQHSRLLIITSEWYENCPMVILEAFASSLPVVGSRIGAIEEMVNANSNGFLYDVGDADDLAKTISEAISDKDVLEKMGRKARSDFEELYSPDRNYSLLMDIYNHAIDDNG